MPTEKITKAARLVIGLKTKTPTLMRRFRFPKSADSLLCGFGHEPVPTTAYDDLMRYMVTSWNHYRTPSGAGACFPGMPSWSGTDCDALEGFSRTMPLFGAWCASGRESTVTLLDGSQVSLTDEFKRGLLAGTDPDGAAYWGDMPGKSNQRIVEAADIALALWLFRHNVWSGLAPSEREAVVNWLSLVNGRPGLDNNWHLFFVLIDRVLTDLGYPGRIRDVRAHFDRVKTFHRGDGWFSDGPNGPVDFYNAWGFHYALTWIQRIDPYWDPEFISATQGKFLGSYKYLIGPKGIPILGRSIQYRMAVPAPLVAGAESHPEQVSPGEARRALDVIWQYFISNGALKNGVITQGYFESDARMLDPYAGPASSLWSLRSLVMALYCPPDHSFWRTPAQPLPVERQKFSKILTGPGWKISGDPTTQAIAIEVLGNFEGAYPELEPFGKIKTLRNLLAGEPQRPTNKAAKYGRRIYRSDQPLFITPRAEPSPQSDKQPLQGIME